MNYWKKDCWDSIQQYLVYYAYAVPIALFWKSQYIIQMS